MSDQFKWQIEEEPEDPRLRAGGTGRRIGSIFFWLVIITAVGSLIGGWVVSRRRAQEDKQQLMDSAQELLNLENQAVSVGDGDLYFSLQESDSEWFSAQLLPENQEISRQGLQITNAEQQGGVIWANAAWDDVNEVLQRVLFFQWRAGQLRQIATDPNYWGTKLQREEDWGDLTYHAIDDPWATSITNFIESSAVDACAEDCPQFTVHIRDDFRETAEPNQINIPSPRLIGLDDEGSPSTRFWQELGKRVQAHLTPAQIRFVVPPSRSREGETILPYELLAEQFMTENPEITVEIIHLEELPEDLSALALEFDGAAFTPTEAMVAAGDVYDLTSFIDSDPDFDKADFYEQIWQGTFWHGRNWFMPFAAEMNVLYYDKPAYENTQQPEPSSRWTWDEMAQDVASVVGPHPQSPDLTWGFLDVWRDSLFSYAYNWNNQCSESATVLCRTPLGTENVAAALDWYAKMAISPGQMPNLTGDLADVFSSTQISIMGDQDAQLDDERVALLLLNFQGSQRKAAIWVDSPVSYEFNFLLSPVGIVPFPGSDRFDGITPLWMRGGFISQYSERPLAVWEWLKFLSYQEPITRSIPARPSVASDTGFWTTLPRPLGDVMRTAFPFARPVTIAEKEMFSWEQIASVVNGELTAQEAAQEQPNISWFNNERDSN